MSDIQVEVTFALPEQQWLVSLCLPNDATAEQAVAASGLLNQVPLALQPLLKLGIYSRLVTADTRLKEGDRVEIYRPLLIDPKEARRARAAKKT